MANEHKLPHWRNNRACLWCPAEHRNNDFENFALVTNWKINAYSPMHNPGPASAHILYNGIPGLGRFNYTGDWMHSIDGGSTAVLHLSCMLDFVDENGPLFGVGVGRDRRQRLWNELQNAYDVCGVTQGRLQSLTKSMLQQSNVFLSANALCRRNW